MTDDLLNEDDLAALRALDTAVTPDTLLRWHRQLIAEVDLPGQEASEIVQYRQHLVPRRRRKP